MIEQKRNQENYDDTIRSIKDYRSITKTLLSARKIWICNYNPSYLQSIS